MRHVLQPLLVPLACLVALPLPAVASVGVEEIGADDFRISAMGGSGNTTYEAVQTGVAYNSIDHEYLVVWSADSDQPGFADNVWGIFGQRLDAATGAAVGPDDFAVSAAIDGNSVPRAYSPQVAYNSIHDEYLVVWSGITAFCCNDFEIFGRRVSAAGLPLGATFQISHMASATAEDIYIATEPALAYNPTADEYLVVWSGDDGFEGLVNEEFEIFGQRLSAADAELGADDFRISDMGVNGSPGSDAYRPAVAYDSVDHEYLVVWDGDEINPPYVDEEREIYAQRLDGATGAELGVNDFRISSIGPPGIRNYLVFEPAVAYEPTRDQYLVVWTAAESAPAPFTWGLEIYSQRLDGANGDEIGTDDARLTAICGLAEVGCNADTPAVVYDPVGQMFLVSFRADDWIEGQGPAGREIFVQAVDAATGAEVGVDDQRISDMGPPYSSLYQAAAPALAAATTSGEFLVVWQGSDDTGGLVVNEHEIFGQRLAGAALFIDDFETGDTSVWSAVGP